MLFLLVAGLLCLVPLNYWWRDIVQRAALSSRAPRERSSSKDVMLLSEAGRMKRINKESLLFNQSTERRKARVIKTSCSCMEASLAQSHIEPGGKLPVFVSLALPREAGVRSARIYIELVGATRETAILEASATFLADMEVEPEHVRFTAGHPRCCIAIYIRRRTDSSMRPPDLVCDYCPDTIKYAIKPHYTRRVLPGKIEEFRFDVDLMVKSADSGDRDLLERVVFSAGAYGSAYVSCYKERPAGIIIAPTKSLVSRIEQGNSIKRRFVLRATDSRPFALLSIAPSSPDVAAVSVTSGERMVHIVDLAVKPSKLGEVDYRVEFQTAHPETPKIMAAIKATVVPNTLAANP